MPGKKKSPEPELIEFEAEVTRTWTCTPTVRFLAPAGTASDELGRLALAAAKDYDYIKRCEDAPIYDVNDIRRRKAVRRGRA